MPEAKGIEVAQANVTANGTEFLGEDLHEIARAFNEQKLSGRLPVKLGHDVADSAPAQGWITAMYVHGDKLLADISDVPDNLVEEIKAGRWRFVSMELLRNAQRNGKKYKWMPDGLALLGAARPAFDALAGLADVFAAGVSGVTFESKFAFSRETGESDAVRLRRENTKLQAQLIHAEFEGAIQSGRILPRDRESFKRRYGENGTADDARAWIASSPVPPGFSSATTTTQQHTSRHTFASPIDEMVARTHERIKFERKEYGRDIDYAAAARLVIREDPEFARQYMDAPSTLARSR